MLTIYNKPFKTHVHKGETSVPSVLPRSYERCDAENTDQCFQMFRQRYVLWTFLTVLWTFLNVLWTFSESFVNVLRTYCQHFHNVLNKHFWTSRKRFAFCKRLVKCLFERFVNVHTVRILCIVRKLLTRPFQRHLTWWGTWLTSKTSLQVIQRSQGP
jgi:hypothetical protein